tara:strand:+ start:220 stop:1284 length:1065 start_codon:yes stop_codon:yes gene_type:complete
VAAKPKVKGLSFNIYAIVTLLVILPISTAFITNLANSNSSKYESSMEANDFIMNHPYMCYDGALIDDNYYIEWLDVGDNVSNLYELNYGASNPPVDYTFMQDGFISGHTNGCNNFYFQYGNDVFWAGSNDNHYRLNSQSFKYPSWGGYIGYSGDDFTFRIDENAFQNLDDSQDLSGLKLTFIDNSVGYNCNSTFFRDISFNYEITIFDLNKSRSKFYGDFEDTQRNSYNIEFDPYNNINDYCVESMSLDFSFSTIESLELNEIFTDYDNLSAIVRVFDIEDEYNLNYSVGFSDLVFTGVNGHQTMLEVKYIDTVQSNLFLNGGTLILGIGLFLLAIASTPYWDPVTNFFKEGNN